MYFDLLDIPIVILTVFIHTTSLVTRSSPALLRSKRPTGTSRNSCALGIISVTVLRSFSSLQEHITPCSIDREKSGRN